MRTEQILKGVLERTDTPNRVCNFYHIHGTMTEEEIHGLYVHPQINAIVSTTHGEGFGLPLYEAAYMGMPVLCPGWSGQEDFLYAPKNPENTKIELRNPPQTLPKPSQDEAKIGHKTVFKNNVL